jgi:hypothetical protein
MSQVLYTIESGLVRICKKCSWKSFYLFISKGTFGSCAIYDCYAWQNVAVLVAICREPLDRHSIIAVKTIFGIFWNQKYTHRKICKDFCRHLIKCKSKIDCVILLVSRNLSHTLVWRIFLTKLLSDSWINYSEGNNLSQKIGEEANSLEYEHALVI